MSIKNKIKSVTSSTAVLWFVVSAAHNPAATAFSPAGAGNITERICAFSLQLQNSAEARGKYVAKVIELAGGDTTGSIEARSGNLKQVSSSDQVQSDAPVDLWGLGGGKTAPKPGLDQMSLDCLGCHDGSAAPVIHTDLRNDPFRKGSRVNSFGGDHPLGMDYRRYVSIRGGYKEIPPGSNKMIFVDGKVGCLTCHDPLNMEKGHLVMSDRNSALCLTCHKK